MIIDFRSLDGQGVELEDPGPPAPSAQEVYVGRRLSPPARRFRRAFPLTHGGDRQELAHVFFGVACGQSFSEVLGRFRDVRQDAYAKIACAEFARREELES